MIDFRIRYPKRPNAKLGEWKKMAFELEIGEAEGEEFFPILLVPDCFLNESREGDLYVSFPQRPGLKSLGNGTYEAVRDEDGKSRWFNTVLFAVEGKGKDAKPTPRAKKRRDRLNQVAQDAYAKLGKERAGVGARQAPAGATTAVAGTAKGLPGDDGDDFDVPFA